MNVLLVNPNTYHTPAVVPVGLEYVASAVRKAGHRADILDLCFVSDPLGDIRQRMAAGKITQVQYDLIGVSIRNVDTALYQNNEWFLGNIREIVQALKQIGVPVVIGGSGLLAAPEAILDFVAGDYAIVGPAEGAIVQLLADIANHKANYRVMNGWVIEFDTAIVHERGQDFDYPQYLAHGGIIGFETQKGCTNACSYCIEAKSRLIFRNPHSVVEELAYLVQQGYHRFHLADCEFNQSLEHSIRFLELLVARNLDLEWVLYMTPYPYNDQLFALLKQSHATLITLSVCSDEREQARAHYGYSDIENFQALCKKHEIRLAIDLLVGFPGETLASVKKMVAFLTQLRPDSVGVNFFFRLYQNTTLVKDVLNSTAHRGKLSRPLKEEEDYLEPVFFNQFSLAEIQAVLGGDPLFTLEGFQKTVNYEREQDGKISKKS
jgi:B12 binding domain/Radical SAM superfamily